eukprot:UN08668
MEILIGIFTQTQSLGNPFSGRDFFAQTQLITQSYPYRDSRKIPFGIFREKIKISSTRALQRCSSST